MQAPEVQALIAERAQLIERGADHYALLGVAATATPDELRKTYFNLARALHPDRLAALGISDDAHVAHKVFAQLNTAFSIVSDAKRRAEYDQLLGRGGEAGVRNDQARAEEMAMRILEAEEAYKKGELALKRDDLLSAISELGHAVELNPDEPDFNALHAWAVFCASPDKAKVARQTRTTLEKAIQRSPRAINPRFYLGRVQRMLGNDKEALQLFRDVLLDKPHHFEAQTEIRAIETRLAANQPKPGGGGLFGRKR
jgi:curved DNA-binding protein CbpA